MSISSEITRITAARDGAFDAVEEKGVLVPVDSTIDDLPGLIRQIPSGNGSAVVVTDTTDSAGGTIRQIDAILLNGDTVTPSVLKQGYTAHDSTGTAITGTAVDMGLWTWQGINFEHVNTIFTKSYTLYNTGFNGWTPSTSSATTIVAAETLSTIALNMVDYNYYIKWKFEVPIIYNSGTSNVKSKLLWQGGEAWQCAYRSKTINQSGVSDTANRNTNNTTAFNGIIAVYYSNATAATWNLPGSYGIYPSLQALAFSNATSNSPNLTVKVPAIATRCSTTYFGTSPAAAIDQNATIITMKGDLYRCKSGGMVQTVVVNSQNMYADYLSGV